MAVARFGGLAILIAGLVSMVSVLIYLNTPPSSLFVTPAEITMTATIDSIFAVIIILGGIAGILRKMFLLAIVGGCVGLLEGIGFSMSGLSIFILILSIIGIVLVAMGYEEFGSGRKRSVRYKQQPATQQTYKLKNSDEEENYSNVLVEYMTKK